MDGVMSPAKQDKIGMLLVGHDTRDRIGAREFLEVSDLIADCLPEVHVEPAFLELAQPSIEDAVRRLLDREIVDLVVVPLLLFAAGHVKEDIPRAVTAATKVNARVTVRYARALELQQKIVEASAERFAATVGPTSLQQLDDAFLIMVGRGSSDSDATAAMRRFTELRMQQTPVAAAMTGFVSIAKPTLSEALQQAAVAPQSIIIVQPHLLFLGQVSRRIAAAVAEAKCKVPHKTWLVSSHLGASCSVAEAAVHRFQEAMSGHADSCRDVEVGKG